MRIGCVGKRESLSDLNAYVSTANLFEQLGASLLQLFTIGHVTPPHGARHIQGTSPRQLQLVEGFDWARRVTETDEQSPGPEAVE